MTFNTSSEVSQRIPSVGAPAMFAFPTSSNLQTPEQIRRFELLRLAFFALKLRKLEQRLPAEIRQESEEVSKEHSDERAFQCNLLRHVIFQQIFTLIQLDARDQAMQIISACQK